MLNRWRRRPSPPPVHGREPAPSTPVRVDELRRGLDSLRTLLATHRSRVRPDTHALLWSVLEHMEGLLPSWERYASVRAADAVQLSDLLEQRLLPGLTDFLALPDSDKPAHADAFHDDVQGWADGLERHRQRLLRVITSRQAARRELDDQPGG